MWPPGCGDGAESEVAGAGDCNRRCGGLLPGLEGTDGVPPLHDWLCLGKLIDISTYACWLWMCQLDDEWECFGMLPCSGFKLG